MRKIKALLTTIVLLLCSTPNFAYDFRVDGICYNKLSSTTVEVTSGTNKYSGEVAIPETVTYEGSTYSVTRIGASTFSGCPRLTSISIPNSVTSIGVWAFYNCSSLTSISIPNSVTSIGDYAFRDCSSLTSMTIGTGVLKIGSSQCTPVKTIWLTNTPPEGYKYLAGKINYVANEQYSFSNMKVYPYLSSLFEADGVKYVPVSPAERTCDAIDCIYDSTVVDINITKTVSYKGVEMKVQEVMPYTAYGHGYVKMLSVANPGSIGNYAFYGCSGIVGATISNAGNIGAGAFSGCSGITKATISNAGDIGVDAFRSCSGITEITISNAGNIGGGAFYGCSGITKATISNAGYIGGNAFRDCASLENLTIGEDVTSLGSYAFNGCKGLKEVKIPNKVSSLGAYCFAYNSLLANIDLGGGVQTIGKGCFASCSMASISIPASVVSIGDSAFAGCTVLADVIIKDRTTELALGSNGKKPLFKDCPLDSVYIGGDISYDSSSGGGYSPFYRNTSLRSVVITGLEEEVPDNEFYGCTNLRNVSIGSNVKKIGKWAFSGCSNLDYFSFGKSVESIGEEAFSDCVNMTRLISHAQTPPACGTQALDDINKWNCKLQVPEGTNSVYMATDQWKDFFFVENTPSAIEQVASPSDSTGDIYDLNGRLVRTQAEGMDGLMPGIYIKNGNKFVVK